MPLAEADLRAFDARGFFVVRRLFSPSEVAEVQAAFERLYDAAQGLRATGDHRGAFFVVDAKSPGPVVVQRVVWAAGMEPALLRLSEDRRLLERALELLGTRRCEQLLCQAHFKMPNDGVAFDWHQDIQHRDKGAGTWRDVTGRGSYVQSILLVDDMNEENGPLEFVPPEAARFDDAGRLVPGSIEVERAIPVTGEAGDVLFFGPYAVHGSLPNVSARPRRVLINGYAAPGANGRHYPGAQACRVLPAAQDEA
ncbi:MAG: phytanoyl-CoA dioxygenase family protein [Polyangiaceae bacterium]|jgi:ectoine hydroxylase-related dioxygenase (phytanoyl-CoA dioxygenase family)|nr:phytanoyl-CoA dioxygenase family protein [Polyangiaceae bacterium]